MDNKSALKGVWQRHVTYKSPLPTGRPTDRRQPSIHTGVTLPAQWPS